MRRMPLAQHFGRITDLAFAGQEHQHVTRATAGKLIDRITDCFIEAIFIGLSLLACTTIGSPVRGTHFFVAHLGSGIFHRPPADFHGVQPPGNLNHRGRFAVHREMLREPFCINRRRGNDDLQILTFL